MKILQLCCFTNLWNSNDYVESIDLKNGLNVLDMPDHYGKSFDLVCAAPPCDQFTLANALRWETFPALYVEIALKCFNICQSTGKYWFFENPPGRIEKFIPELKQYRVLTWTGYITNKQYVVYSNFIVFDSPKKRYGKKNITRSKTKREAWQPDFIEQIKKNVL
jgi:site-specific DNA-cytosine methylase